jgi:hypothetical protein
MEATATLMLYGEPIEVYDHPIREHELVLIGPLRYVIDEDTGEVFVLYSYLTKAKWLRGYDLIGGREAIIPINNHSFCERP